MSSRDKENIKIIRHNFLSSRLDYPLPKKYYFFQNLLRLIFFPFSLLRIYLLIIRHDIDILHFQWSHIPLLEYLLVFFAKKKCTTVFTYHNTTLFHGEKHFIKYLLSFGSKLLIETIDKVIVHTEYSKKIFSNKYPKITNKSYVVPHGKDYFLTEKEINKASIFKFTVDQN